MSAKCCRIELVENNRYSSSIVKFDKDTFLCIWFEWYRYMYIFLASKNQTGFKFSVCTVTLFLTGTWNRRMLCFSRSWAWWSWQTSGSRTSSTPDSASWPAAAAWPTQHQKSFWVGGLGSVAKFGSIFRTPMWWITREFWIPSLQCCTT